MDLGLKGKAALVGGSSKGIGRAVAIGLAREGCNVAICARDNAALAQTASTIRRETDAEVFSLVCDMSRYEDIKRVVPETVKSFPRLAPAGNTPARPPPRPVGGKGRDGLAPSHQSKPDVGHPHHP